MASQQSNAITLQRVGSDFSTIHKYGQECPLTDERYGLTVHACVRPEAHMRPTIHVAADSGALDCSLPRMTPATARWLARALEAAADEAERQEREAAEAAAKAEAA